MKRYGFYTEMGMAELYDLILRLYPGVDPRPLIISVPPNSYGVADYIYIDHHGSPPKGGAIYNRAHKELYLLTPGLTRKRRVGANVCIPALENLPVGFFSWTPREGLREYTSKEVSVDDQPS